MEAKKEKSKTTLFSQTFEVPKYKYSQTGS